MAPSVAEAQGQQFLSVISQKADVIKQRKALIREKNETTVLELYEINAKEFMTDLSMLKICTKQNRQVRLSLIEAMQFPIVRRVFAKM